MRLPISGLEVSFRLPNGHDDLAILEASSGPFNNNRVDPHSSEAQATILERALDALSRLAQLRPSAAGSSDTTTNVSIWPSLTITDFESALLGLRCFLFGDTVRCIVRCACTERMEIDFSIAHLLRETHPRTPTRIQPSTTRPGWFELHHKHHQLGARTIFRLPTVGDQLLALRSLNPYGLLEERCIETGHSDRRRATGSAERAMESMSPTVSRPIDGVCAACGGALNPQLHVSSLVLDELRASAAGVHREIHAIAATYHWDESALLAMPQLRRLAYTDAIREAGTR
jgi:hypothetical protein